jgi:hypothetical protein
VGAGLQAAGPAPVIGGIVHSFQESTISLVKPARCIYSERRFADLPGLADALEEAGCTNEDVLAHCRQPGEHARGCWVLDLMLRKT